MVIDVRVDNTLSTFSPGEIITIGRDVGSTIHVTEAMVSRLHASVRFENGAWWIEDSSRRGTYVEGQRIRKVAVLERSTVTLGAPDSDVVLTLEPRELVVGPASSDTVDSIMSNARRYSAIVRTDTRVQGALVGAAAAGIALAALLGGGAALSVGLGGGLVISWLVLGAAMIAVALLPRAEAGLSRLHVGSFGHDLAIPFGVVACAGFGIGFVASSFVSGWASWLVVAIGFWSARSLWFADPVVSDQGPDGTAVDAISSIRVVAGSAAVDRVPSDPHIVVGRGSDADVQIGDPRVSRRHLIVRFDGDSWTVDNVGGRGTFCDGRSIENLRIDGAVRVRLADPSDGPEIDLVTARSVGPPAGHDLAASFRPARHVGWTRRLVVALIAGVLAAGLGFVMHIYVLSQFGTIALDGIPVGLTIPGPGNRVAGSASLFLVLSAFGYLFAMVVTQGPTYCADAVRHVARSMSPSTIAGQRRRRAYFLGVAGAVVAGALAFPGMTGEDLIKSVNWPLVSMEFTVALGIWLMVLPFTPLAARLLGQSRSDRSEPPISQYLLSGVGLGLFAQWFLGSTVAVAVGVVGAVALSGAFKGRSPSVAALLFAVAVAVGIYGSSAGPAAADDGGWVECGSSWSSYTGCDGSDEVIDDGGHAVPASAAGSALGALAAMSAALVVAPGAAAARHVDGKDDE